MQRIKIGDGIYSNTFKRTQEGGVTDLAGASNVKSFTSHEAPGSRNSSHTEWKPAENHDLYPILAEINNFLDANKVDIPH